MAYFRRIAAFVRQERLPGIGSCAMRCAEKHSFVRRGTYSSVLGSRAARYGVRNQRFWAYRTCFPGFLCLLRYKLYREARRVENDRF